MEATRAVVDLLSGSRVAVRLGAPPVPGPVLASGGRGGGRSAPTDGASRAVRRGRRVPGATAL